jgi:CcmD family protein
MKPIRIAYLMAALLVINFPAGAQVTDGKTGVYAQADTARPHAGAVSLRVTPVQTQEKIEDPAAPSIVLYQVMGVVLAVWLGLAAFLFRLDRKVAGLEREIRDLKKSS